MSDTQTLERSDTETGHEDPIVAHLVPKDRLTEAYVLGYPVKALCGKVWVPSRDPLGKPLCAACKQIAEGAFGLGFSEGVQ